MAEGVGYINALFSLGLGLLSFSLHTLLLFLGFLKISLCATSCLWSCVRVGRVVVVVVVVRSVIIIITDSLLPCLPSENQGMCSARDVSEVEGYINPFEVVPFCSLHYTSLSVDDF